MKFKIFLVFIVFSFFEIFAQQPSTSSDLIQKSLKQKTDLQENSIVKNVPFKNIGPTIMSGRVSDLAVNPDDPTEFYVAYASGGVWHTINNGTTFTPILDNTQTQNTGDIDVHWKSKTIWVGTGETISSRSSYSGIGILKSTNNGETWENVGLQDSHHISRIQINPNNKDEVVVAVLGHLYSKNQERGIYKTTDGGKTWKQTLFVDIETGIIDLQFNPNNFKTMFATSWTRDRKAWDFNGSGNNSAIYKSNDAGETWNKVSTKSSGFPTGDGVGRIGVAVFNENIVYAALDNQFRRPKEDDKIDDSKDFKKDDFKNMTFETFLKLDDEKLNTFLKENGFKKKYKAKNVKEMVKSGEIKPLDLASYLEDSNSVVFDTKVIAAEVYKSIDGGKTWDKTHSDYLDGIYNSYGYVFGNIFVSPKNENHIYIYGVPIVKSKDGGKTFISINADNVHVDHHMLWINPNNPNHLINGNDGGLNMTYDDGANWIKNNSPSVGQFYSINVDNQKPYNVYGGFQDNGTWVGPHNNIENTKWHQEGQYPWERISGGDGMQVQIDTRNPNIVYAGSQFGYYSRINRATGNKTFIKPEHNLGQTPYRFNWQTPILLSSHNQDILYLGANKLMRSMNKGDDWEEISNDLTSGGKKGNVPYGTLTSISESPFQFGLIYVGSDDGFVHITKDGGVSWDKISDTFPKDLWVSRVVASQHKKERVYVTLNGYRWDDFNVYVYVSEDYGKTWKSINSNIPLSPVNVIKEDPVNENILYLGTDNGAYISFNKGNSWEAFSEGLPPVAIHDLVIQPEAKDLVLGTHGRSIYIADIEDIQKMTLSKMDEAIVLFKVDTLKHSKQWGNAKNSWTQVKEPSVSIKFYSNSDKKVNLKILSEKKKELKSITVEAEKGFNYLNYDLTISELAKNALLKENKELEIEKAKNEKQYLPIGNYTIQIEFEKTNFKIE